VAEAALPDILVTKQPGKGQDAPQIFLRADRSLDYGRVMGVMGELNRAGLNKVSLVTTGALGGASDDAAAEPAAE